MGKSDELGDMRESDKSKAVERAVYDLCDQAHFRKVDKCNGTTGRLRDNKGFKSQQIRKQTEELSLLSFRVRVDESSSEVLLF